MINTGFHLILDCRRVHKKMSIDQMIAFIDNICKTYNFTVINSVKNQFGTDPYAYTILYLLAESHISVHTYFEHDYVAVDIYTCSKTVTEQDYATIARLFGRYLGCVVSYNILSRTTD